MTLYKQLLLWTFIFLVCLCGGLWMGELSRTRGFLIKQLESHTQETASSLGLSLTALTKGIDIPVMESMVNALFDSGYYQSIRIHDVNGEILVQRLADTEPDQAPDWFVRAVSLPAPQAEAPIMEGWQQVGMVMVQSHPGYAYQMLWDSARTTALWFILTAAAITVLGGLALKRLLRPLARIEEQALALCERRFLTQDSLPHTREFRRVVLAMNKMTNRIQEMFAEQTAIADTLLSHTYQDPLTGIGNRRYLETQVRARVEEKTAAKGSFLLLQIRDLQAINQNHGYPFGDQLLKEAALILQEACTTLPEAVIGRLGGGDFALLLPNTGEQEAQQTAESILTGLRQQVAANLPEGEEIHTSCGGVTYEEPTLFTRLLTHADTALHKAGYHHDSKAVFLSLDDDEQPAVQVGKTESKTLLNSILAARSIILYSQPTLSRREPGHILHHEILTRVIDSSGRHLSAGMFLPMAERLGLMTALDRLILEQLFTLPLRRLVPARLSVNLSPLSLLDEEFRVWLHRHLEQCARDKVQMYFEFAEFRTRHYDGLIRDFAAAIKKMGHAIGIDHFGQGLVHFGYLQSLLPDYVKIDRAITRELKDERSDSYFFINALCTVAHSLDIRVIVEGIENEGQAQALEGIHIDALQGFHLQKPKPLDLSE